MIFRTEIDYISVTGEKLLVENSATVISQTMGLFKG